MVARTAVGGGGTLKEDERRPIPGRVAHAREEPLVLPGREQLFLERVDRLRQIGRRIRHRLELLQYAAHEGGELWLGPTGNRDDRLDRRRLERAGQGGTRDERTAEHAHGSMDCGA